MVDRVRIGVVGVGAQGRLYATLVSDGRAPSLELAALCSSNPNSSSHESHAVFAQQMGVPLFTDYGELLDSGAVDAVVITTPHYEHPRMAIEAIEHGIHVLLEKPAGIYGKQVVRLLDSAVAHPQVTFAMMFNQRANPLFADLKSMIDSGEFGALRRTSWQLTHWWRPDAYYTSSAWRATWGTEGGGVLVNQAPHQLDLWQWLCGTPLRCFARVRFGFRRDIPVEDEVSASLEFPGGANGVFITSTNDLVGTDRLELSFDKARVLVDNSLKMTIDRFTDDERQIARTISDEDAALVPSGAFDRSVFFASETREYTSAWGEQHSLLLDNFGKHITDGTPLIAPGADGLTSVRLANAMQLSGWTGQDIELARFDDDAYLAELNKRIEEEGRFPARS
ncbi:Gfo/Idh/MocA family oxidoreductase [Propionimicrobium sp. PCR01-08-3]|uniref:Gfo/Idh/MocA family protein n=1 Tax=Propionimicrobium sp. PCR01-08-3 TaxID=3052086 RepID=UPI00255CC0C0|nr:Gfo/Idh/MocA family oxidoreductase [Propionimicrobium sp. PCR01-08-3]WIY81553.1 Gfo/Idh/MocA family oxidoreductase [Propionimicrobium sp. PCR01-08-3]